MADTGAKQPRGVEVAFSTAQLDDIDDSALSDMIDDFMLGYSAELRESVALWLDAHADDDLQGQFDAELAEPLR